MKILNLKEGEFQALYVRANHIDKVILGVSKKTWANWRYNKIGPKYYKVKGSVYYKISDLVEYFEQQPILTWNN